MGGHLFKAALRFLVFVLILCIPAQAYAVSTLDVLTTRLNGTNVTPEANTSIFVPMSQGDSFSFYIDVENNGDDSPGGFNGITASFPSFTSSTYKSNVTYTGSLDADLTYDEYFGSEAGGGDGYANYVMVEVVDTNDWDGSDYLSAENNSVTLQITPKANDFSNEYFDIYYRVGASHTTSWADINHNPASGNYTDCLGFSSYRIRVYLDSTPPSNPGNFSSTPLANAWTSDNIIDVSWSGASDNRGLQGYYYRWTTNSTSSVTTSTYDGYTSTSSGSGSKRSSSLADGQWYFHVRYVDSSGNLASSTKHYGPFKIDRTDPSVPSLLSPSSNSHITDTTPNFDWTTSSDSGSGVQKYQIIVETDTIRLNKIDSESTGSSYTASSGEALDAGGAGYYWRVRACDNAGNCSSWTDDSKFYVDDPLIVTSIVASLDVDGSLDDTSATTEELYTRNATIYGSGTGTVGCRWEWKQPGGVWEPILDRTVTMTNGQADVSTGLLNVVPPSGIHTFRLVVTSPSSVTSNEVILDVTALQPDLQVTSLSIASDGQPGDTVNVSATVKNLGNGGSYASTLGFFLSTDNVRDGADTYLGSLTTNPLSPNATQSYSNVSLTIPAGTASGTYYIIAYADYLDEDSHESLENNNSSAVQILVGCTATSVVASLDVDGSLDDSRATTEDLYTRNATIYGSGTGTVGYRWEWKQPGGVWEPILDRTVTMTNGQADISTGLLNVVPPSGIHTFRLVVTSPNSVTSNEVILDVTALLPDLQVTSLDIDTTEVKPGDAVNVSATVKNLGNGGSYASSLGFFLSTDTELDGADTELGSEATNHLSPNATQSYSNVSLTIPGGTASGTYYIIAYADYLDEDLHESLENNNSSATTLSVVVAQTSQEIKYVNHEGLIVGSTTTFKINVVAQENAEYQVYAYKGVSLIPIGSSEKTALTSGQTYVFNLEITPTVNEAFAITFKLRKIKTGFAYFVDFYDLLVVVDKPSLSDDDLVGLRYDTVDKLINAFMPVFKFNDDSEYAEIMPMDIRDVLGNAVLRNREDNSFLKTNLIVDDLFTYSGSDFYLDYNDMSDYLGSSYENTIYVTAVKDNGYIILQYWFPYYYNFWHDVGGMNIHEGDWESITITFEMDETPLFATYSQHKNIVTNCLELKNYCYGGSKRLWEHIPKFINPQNLIDGESQHPVVYVAYGSHASYFEAGETNILGLYPDRHYGTGAWLFPSSVSSEYANQYSTTISSLLPRGSELTQAHPNSWLTYSGYWGDITNFISTVLVNNGPRGPMFREDSFMWLEPWNWQLEKVVDTSGAWDTDDFRINILSMDTQAPTVSTPVNFSVTASNLVLPPNNSSATVYYAWDFNNDEVVDEITYPINNVPDYLSTATHTFLTQGEHTVKVQAYEVNPISQESFGHDTRSIIVNFNADSPLINTIDNHAWDEEVSYFGPVPAVSGTTPFTWSLVSSPLDMTIDSYTGVVTWDSPSAPGSPHTITIKATNVAGSSTETWLLTVNPIAVAPAINPISNDSVNEGILYTGPAPFLSAGTLPVAWSLVANPAGMTIDSSTGIVTWDNPVTTGSPHVITIKATNVAGSSTETWLLTVNPSVIEPPISDVTIWDSSQLSGDLFVNFDEVSAGGSATADHTIQIINNGVSQLNMDFVNTLSGPFTIVTEDCTSKAPVNGEWCEINVRFNPQTVGDHVSSLDVTYNDIDSGSTITDTIYVTGRMLADQDVNKRPTAPVLLLPYDGASDVQTPTTFSWGKSMDADALTYDLFVCEAQSFTGCSPVNVTPIPVNSKNVSSTRFAGMTIGYLVIGLIITGSLSGRRRWILLGILVTILIFSFVACGHEGGRELQSASYDYSSMESGRTYYWKVVAEDTVGNRTDSDVWSFTVQ